MVATAPYAGGVGSHAGLAGTLKRQAFVINFDTAALTDEADIPAGHLPAHVLVTGGFFVADDLDSSGTTMELDWGWANNGADQTDGYVDPYGVSYDNAGYQASQTGFLDSGALTAAAVTNVLAAGMNYRPVLLSKPIYFKRETQVVAHVEALAATQAAGSGTLYLDYMVP
jgi:hypothetical protein